MVYQSFNEQYLLKQFQGDEEILLEMIDAFSGSYEDLIGSIRKSIQEKQGDELRLHAHTFKGILRNFFSENGAKIAYELELRGHKSQFEDSSKLLAQLEEHMSLFLGEIAVFKDHLDKRS